MSWILLVGTGQGLDQSLLTGQVQGQQGQVQQHKQQARPFYLAASLCVPCPGVSIGLSALLAKECTGMCCLLKDAVNLEK
jgi:hypothetical protein